LNTILLRVLFVLPNLEYCGAVSQVLLLATNLPRASFAVRVCGLGKEGPAIDTFRAAGIEVEALDWTRAVDLKPMWRLRQLVRSFQPDIVHTWRRLSFGAALVARQRRINRLVAGDISAPPKATILRRLEHGLLRRADCLSVRDSLEAERWRRLGFSSERIVLLPPGVLPVNGATSNVGSFRPVLDLPPDARIILCVGPLEPRKGFRDAIWAFDILRHIYDDIHLVFVGDGPERQLLERFVYSIRAVGRVHFLGTQNDLAHWLGQTDIVWVPSRRPAGVQVALEAMMSGRPVVASRLPCLTEVIADNQTGFLFPVGDKAALARQSRLLLEDPERAKLMGEAGRQRALSHFSPTKMLKHVASLYGNEC
jgi:glycosyltransferase involved in cell wall biosynthesis